MAEPTELIEWIVKTALTDEAVTTEELVNLMKKNQLTSENLLNYINDNVFWPIHQSDSSFKLSPQDEKYIVNFKNPERKKIVSAQREEAREAVHSRFYTGHRFNEWMI